MKIREFFKRTSDLSDQVVFDKSNPEENRAIVLFTMDHSPKPDDADNREIGVKVLGNEHAMAELFVQGMETSDEVAAAVLAAVAEYFDGAENASVKADFIRLLLRDCQCPICKARRLAEKLKEAAEASRRERNVKNPNIN